MLLNHSCRLSHSWYRRNLALSAAGSIDIHRILIECHEANMVNCDSNTSPHSLMAKQCVLIVAISIEKWFIRV